VECHSRSAASLHQRAQDFDYSNKADGKRDNGDGELLTNHLFAAKSAAYSTFGLILVSPQHLSALD
jgi:hypothetical protein